MNEPSYATLGIVIIARNEGERLRRCLDSIARYNCAIAYVDSGSTDGSLELARTYTDTIITLDTSIPFTAARARNAGAGALLQQQASLTHLQFIDGDCMLDQEWLPVAIAHLENHPDVAVVCGRRKETRPEASVYNQLCDMEWDRPNGKIESCGGDFLIRVAAFVEISGFRNEMIAGEEPEMCYRLRQAGWSLEKIDHPMTYHDADMHRFGQFWKRAKRSGHAYAQCASLYGRGQEKFKVRELMSIALYALALPVALVGAAIVVSPVFLLVLATVYGLLLVKIQRAEMSRGTARQNANLYARFVILGKFAQLSGVWEFIKKKVANRQLELIEYK